MPFLVLVAKPLDLPVGRPQRTLSSFDVKVLPDGSTRESLRAATRDRCDLANGDTTRLSSPPVALGGWRA